MWIKNEIYNTKSPEETFALGERFGEEILKKGLEGKTLFVGLVGELGSGKTVFVQGVASGLNIRKKITSPTYVIMRRFELSESGFENFYHIDCYRLKKWEELLDLGLADIKKESGNIVFVEWANRVEDALPDDTVWIRIDHSGKDRRRVVVEGRGKRDG